jgi:hypothetical protein
MKITQYILLHFVIITCINGNVHAQLKNNFGDFSYQSSIRIQLVNENLALHLCFKAQELFDKENYAAAIKRCDKAIQLNPACAVAFRLRAYSKIEIDSVKSGCLDLQRSAVLSDSSIWSKISNKHYKQYCSN